MKVKITPRGKVILLYEEEVGLIDVLGGTRHVERVSHVEPDEKGDWWAIMIHGPKLGPFPKRSQALQAEVQWLETNTLT